MLQAADAAFYVAGFRLPRRFAPRNDEVDADHLVIFVKSIGGSSRSRTGVHGFAGRCITTLPSSQCNEANFSQKNRVKRTFLYPILLRPTLSRIFIGQCFLRGSARPIVIFITAIETWSGKRDSNSRPQPWQGCALPAELFPLFPQRRHCSVAGKNSTHHPPGVNPAPGVFSDFSGL